MATTATYYFEFDITDTCVGYTDTQPNTDVLPKDVSFLPKTTTNPNKYIGISLVEFESETPTFPPADPRDKTTAEWLRMELKKLHFEIQFTASLSEDTTALQAAYDAKLIEYNNAINPPVE